MNRSMPRLLAELERNVQGLQGRLQQAEDRLDALEVPPAANNAAIQGDDAPAPPRRGRGRPPKRKEDEG